MPFKFPSSKADWAQFRHSLRVEGSPDASMTRGQAFLTNRDLQPLPKERRTWTSRSYVAFWISDSVNLSSAVIVASSVQEGLAWWHVFIAVLLGYSIAAVGVVLMARPAAMNHIGFPVLARAPFGIIFSVWPIINRVATATLWFAFQSALGGQCITVILRSLAPQYANLKNTLPDSAGITTRDLISFLLFWLCCVPAVLTKPEKIKWLFYIKSAVVPIAFLAFLGWSVRDAGGLGPIVKQKATLQGKALGWAFVSACMSQLSNMVTLLLNAGDFARLARRPSDTVVPQLVTMPVSFALTALVGLWIASSSTVIFNTSVFNPLQLLSLRLDRDPYDASTRAGAFFIGAALTIGQLGTNVAANSLSAGSDLAAMLPRYISITRGGFICALISLIIQPWRFANDSSSFATYLSSYSVLLSPFLGVMLCDYYVVRRGKLRVEELYTLDRASAYMYGSRFGLNWRSLLAYAAGIAFNMPGFVGAIRGTPISEAAQRIYQLAFFTGTLVSALVYALASHVAPPTDGVALTRRGWHEEPAGGRDAADGDSDARGEDEESRGDGGSERGETADEKKSDDEKMEAASPAAAAVSVQPYL